MQTYPNNFPPTRLAMYSPSRDRGDCVPLQQPIKQWRQESSCRVSGRVESIYYARGHRRSLQKHDRLPFSGTWTHAAEFLTGLPLLAAPGSAGQRGCAVFAEGATWSTTRCTRCVFECVGLVVLSGGEYISFSTHPRVLGGATSRNESGRCPPAEKIIRTRAKFRGRTGKSSCVRLLVAALGGPEMARASHAKRDVLQFRYSSDRAWHLPGCERCGLREVDGANRYVGFCCDSTDKNTCCDKDNTCCVV